MGVIKWIIIIALVVCFVIFPFVRCVMLNPHFTAYYGTVDLYKYFRYKLYNSCKRDVGQLNAYCGLFGKGKTLSCVHKVVSLYNRYNNKMIYDEKDKKWKRQQVIVLSNVVLNIPYVYCESLKQITRFTKEVSESDKDNGTITFIVCLLDELSVQMNSRNFKTNIDALFLNTILTCRHYNLSIYYTAQRFSQVDALLRQVTQSVFECNKVWRLQGLKEYDAYELENCINPTLVQPKWSGAWFVRNKDYNAYDTYACVENLEHAQETGQMLADSEILERIAPQMVGADTVVKYSKKARKRKPNKKKYSS